MEPKTLPNTELHDIKPYVPQSLPKIGLVLQALNLANFGVPQGLILCIIGRQYCK